MALYQLRVSGARRLSYHVSMLLCELTETVWIIGL